MTSEIMQSHAGGVVRVRISRLMTVADLRTLESIARLLLDSHESVRVLVTLEDFEGWENNEAWDEDLDFQLEYGHRIGRIAIVGDEQWREPARLFVGQGLRRTDIEFFPVHARDAANAWIGR